MSSTTSTASSGGLGFTGVLTLAFIVLKLTHVIDWSWWWVLSPTLIAGAFSLIVMLVVFVFLWRNR